MEAGRGPIRDEEILFQSDHDRDDSGISVQPGTDSAAGRAGCGVQFLVRMHESAGAVVSWIDAAGQGIDKRGIIEGHRADQSVPADHRAVLDLDRGCGAAFKHAAADCRRAGQRDAGRLHGGRKALQELGIPSPFLEAAMDKADIRRLAFRLGKGIICSLKGK